MNRRLFLRTGLLTLLAAASGCSSGGCDRADVILRRVDIYRNGRVLRDQPFRAIRQHDLFKILGEDDACAGKPYRAVSELVPSNIEGMLGCDVEEVPSIDHQFNLVRG